MTSPRTPLRTELTRHLFGLIGSVVVLDVVAIALYFGLHVMSATPRTQAMFAGAWIGLTLVIVLVWLGKIRAARLRARRARIVGG